ncbi:MAG: OmpA family protein [Bacteroidota bacterium]
MKTTKSVLFILSLTLFMGSCVSNKKFIEMQGNRDKVQSSLNSVTVQFRDCEKQSAEYKTKLTNKDLELMNERSKVASLEQQLDYLKSTNTNVLDLLADLSVVSKKGADNIKKTLDFLHEQDKYIKDLTSSIRTKDSLNLALVMNLKRSLADVNDDDITIEIKKGVVYISLSDKMLFKTGSAQILPDAEAVLGKIAKVVKDHQNLDILVEGHTDNVPIKTECMADNWDLSAKRATSVVRTLQVKYGVRPERMTAGGRSEYIPKTSNDTANGKSLNRRTEIIILPKLDEFFQLLVPPASSN